MKKLRAYKVVLAVPDILHRKQTLSMVDMFLSRFQFKSIYIHKESILAAFGAGMNLCCVVDIGSDKLQVSCVEEGQIIRNTLFRKNFGSKDLDWLYKLMVKKHDRIKFLSGQGSDLESGVQMNQVTKIKEIAMSFNKTEDNSDLVFKCVSEDAQKATMFEIKLDDSIYVTPHCLWYAKTFNLFKRHRKFKSKLQFQA